MKREDEKVLEMIVNGLTRYQVQSLEMYLNISLLVDLRLQIAWAHFPTCLTLDNGKIQAGTYDYEN